MLISELSTVQAYKAPTINDNLSRRTPPDPGQVLGNTGEVAGVGEPGADDDEVALSGHDDPVLILCYLAPVFDPGESERGILDHLLVALN